jgi:hypothetical protein
MVVWIHDTGDIHHRLMQGIVDAIRDGAILAHGPCQSNDTSFHASYLVWSESSVHHSIGYSIILHDVILLHVLNSERNLQKAGTKEREHLGTRTRIICRAGWERKNMVNGRADIFVDGLVTLA